MSVAIASLADAALILPAVLALMAYLAWQGEYRSLGALVAAFAFCVVATLAAKFGFRVCTDGRASELASPSGHASLSTFFYGALAVLLATGRRRAQQIAITAVTLLFLAAVGASRVDTLAHSPGEVAVGWGLGLLSLALFLLVRAGRQARALPLAPLALGLLVAIALFGGRHLSAERTIGNAARRLTAAIDLCRPPFGSDRTAFDRTAVGSDRRAAASTRTGERPDGTPVAAFR